MNNSKLTIIKETGKDSRNYIMVECQCTCGDIAEYRRSDVASGRKKGCAACSSLKKFKTCQNCSKLISGKEIAFSDRFGCVCKECFKKLCLVKCKECDSIVDTKVGNHSGLCSDHWNLHRLAYCLYYATKYRANKQGLDFDLTVDWIKARITVCEVTGIKLKLRDAKLTSKLDYSNRPPDSPSIDKINPKLGYTKDNCRIVCWWYNLSKSTWSDREIFEIVKTWIGNRGQLGSIY
jgi:hypothetical protein